MAFHYLSYSHICLRGIFFKSLFIIKECFLTLWTSPLITSFCVLNLSALICISIFHDISTFFFLQYRWMTWKIFIPEHPRNPKIFISHLKICTIYCNKSHPKNTQDGKVLKMQNWRYAPRDAFSDAAHSSTARPRVKEYTYLGSVGESWTDSFSQKMYSWGLRLLSGKSICKVFEERWRYIFTS